MLQAKVTGPTAAPTIYRLASAVTKLSIGAQPVDSIQWFTFTQLMQ